MSITKIPAGFADTLRKRGAKVVELDGWENRLAVGSGNDSFAADRGLLWHHTGGSPDDLDYVRWMAFTGRSDLSPSLCNFALNRAGTIFMCAAGRANHAGTARPAGSMAGGDGNRLYAGVECLNTGSEGWKPAQYDAMVLLGAAWMDLTGNSIRAQAAHRETSVTGKWDPGMLDMGDFRADIAKLNAFWHKKPDPDPHRGTDAPLAAKTLGEVDDLIRALTKQVKGGRPRVSRIAAEHRDDLLPSLRKLRRDLRDVVKNDHDEDRSK